jgi:hypothetical protein
MSEFNEPIPVLDGFKGSRGIDRALNELADISRMRSQAHEAANLFRDFHIEVGGITERQLRRELQDAQGVLARWAIMAAHEEFRTVDLARIENGGDWDATAETEEGIGGLALDLFMDGQIEGLIERDTSKAKLRITVDPGLLSGHGLIAVRRKRLMLATKSVLHEFSDMRPTGRGYAGPAVPRGHLMNADVSLEVDKVSEFVLDFRRFEAADPSAANEVRRAVKRIGAAEITAMEGAVSPAVVEGAIIDRDPMLAPAITTYYADRKYKNIRRLDEGVEARARELAPRRQ